MNESHRNMAAEIKKEIQLEIAHVLFIDIVGYSKLSINEQHAAVEELNRIVRASEQFQRAEAANRLLKISTGDGIALVFYTGPEAPVQCAVEISRRATAPINRSHSSKLPRKPSSQAVLKLSRAFISRRFPPFVSLAFR